MRSLIAETYLRSLHLPNIVATSSGTNVTLDSKEERQFFAYTIALFVAHGIEEYAKNTSHQLTQVRTDAQDVTVCMNRRVIDEASKLVTLPKNIQDWSIVDIGEGHRTIVNNKKQYEEEIFHEVTKKVDELIKQLAK